MIEVELFDGTVLEFPEGTSPDVIDRVARQETATRQSAAPAAMAPAPQEPGLLDTIMQDYVAPAGSAVSFMGQEAARGVTNVLGAPVDLINASPQLLNILPGEQGMTSFSQTPFGGSESLWNMLTAPRDAVQGAVGAEVGDQTPQNATERVLGRVAQEVGANAIPIAGGMAAAARMGTQGARNLGGPVGNFVESFAVNPARAAGKETMFAAGAGAGAGLAREAYSDGDPNTTTPGEATADLIGALGGGLTVGAVDAAGRALMDTGRAITGRGNQSIVNAAVADELGRAANVPLTREGVPDTELLGAILGDGTNRVSQVVPGFRPSTGDVAQNPGLQNLEYARQSGPNAGMWNQRRQDNMTAATQAVDDLAPTATPGAFSEPLAMRRDEALLRAETEAYVARDQFDKAISNLNAVQTGEARGQTIRSALEEALDAARGVERQAWSQVSGEADIAPLAGAFDNVTNRLTLAEREAIADMGSTLDIPARLMPEDDVAATMGSAVQLEEITGLRSRLTTAQRQAEAGGDPNKARILGQYVDQIDGYLNEVPEVGEALAQARAVSRDLNDRFTRRGTPVADTLASRPSGGPSVPDSRVAPQFVQPDSGQGSNVARLLNETGPTQQAAQAQEAVRDQILADVRQRGLLEKPDQLEAYLGQYGQVFERFPELKNDLGNAANLRRTAADAEQLKTATTRELGEGGASAVAKYLRFGDERSVDAMSTVVNAADPASAADELVSFVGRDPGAIEGARSAFWQLMSREARSTGATTRTADGTQPWRPASLSRFLNDPKARAVAERLYADNPEHLENLTEIASTLQSVDLRGGAKAPNTSGTAQGLSGSDILPSAETLGSRAFAVKRGQVGVGFATFNIASIIARRAVLKGRTQEFQRLLDEALLNPEIAANLTREYNPANLKAMSRMAKSWLGTRAAWLDDLAAEDEPSEDDEMMNAITGGE